MQVLILFLLAGIFYLIQSSYYSKHWSDHLKASIKYSKTHAMVGDSVELYEKISNHKSLPLPVLNVKFMTSRTFLFEDMDNSTYSDYYYRNDIFSILGNQQIRRTLSFRTSKRGYYTVDAITLVAKDLFLSNPEGLSLDNHCGLYVFPQALNGHQTLSLTNQLIGDILTKQQQQDPLSFRNIRDYSPGDEMRFINWKASARQQQLMVNTYFDTQTTTVVLLVNFDTNSMIRIDWMREYIASVATTLLQAMNHQNFTFQLITNAKDSVSNSIYHTEAGSGAAHLQKIYEGLATLDLVSEPSDFLDTFQAINDTGHNTSYVVLSNYRKQDLLDLYSQKQAEGYPMYFICPELTTYITDYDFNNLKNMYYWRVNANEI